MSQRRPAIISVNQKETIALILADQKKLLVSGFLENAQDSIQKSQSVQNSIIRNISCVLVDGCCTPVVKKLTILSCKRSAANLIQ
jgi:hypothetical protein